MLCIYVGVSMHWHVIKCEPWVLQLWCYLHSGSWPGLANDNCVSQYASTCMWSTAKLRTLRWITYHVYVACIVENYFWILHYVNSSLCSHIKTLSYSLCIIIITMLTLLLWDSFSLVWLPSEQSILARRYNSKQCWRREMYVMVTNNCTSVGGQDVPPDILP